MIPTRNSRGNKYVRGIDISELARQSRKPISEWAQEIIMLAIIVLCVIAAIMIFPRKAHSGVLQNIGIGVDMHRTYFGQQQSDYKINTSIYTNIGYLHLLNEKYGSQTYTGIDTTIQPLLKISEIMMELNWFYNEGTQLDVKSLRFGIPLVDGGLWAGLGINRNETAATQDKIVAILKVNALGFLKFCFETCGGTRIAIELKASKDWPITDKLYISPNLTIKQVDSEYYWQTATNITYKFWKDSK